MGFVFFLAKFSFILLALAAVPHEPIDCRALYAQTTPSAGPFVAHVGSFSFTKPEGDYYELGRGSAGGTVYRVIPSDVSRSTYLVKIYRGDPPTRAEMNRNHDAEVMRVFGETYEGTESPFRIPKVQPIGKDTLEMEDTPGRDLHSILLDPAVSEAVKEQLREAYSEKLSQFSNFIWRGPRLKHKTGEAIRDYFREGKLDGLKTIEATYFQPGTDKPISILIKSDNIIVTWVGGENPFIMTLVDPY